MSDDLEDLCHEELAHTDGPVTRKLKQQTQRIEQLEEEVAIARRTSSHWKMEHLEGNKRIEKLEVALRPFADMGKYIVEHNLDAENNHETGVSIGELKAAYAALEGKSNER